MYPNNRTDTEPEADSPRPLRRTWVWWTLVVGWLLAAVAFLFGLSVFAPYLQREHRRIYDWQIVLVWAGDGVSCLWFLYFGVKYIVLARPLPSQRSERRFGREFVLVTTSLAAGLAADLAISLGIMRQEKEAYQRGEVVGGEVLAFERFQNPTRPWVGWRLECAFRDRTGVTHDVVFVVRGMELPPQTLNWLNRGRLPAPVPIRYDPQFPNRNWLASMSDDWGNRLHWMSLALLFFQFGFIALLAFSGWVWETPEGCVPLDKVLPFLVLAGFWCLFGAVQLAVRAPL